ncbi:FAD-dependent oxidoreductase [Pseudoduganella eburnea]|uniref:FAD-dependent oxidoreductase n=1 Tax=Massilia eburnea TaxID=1776165 RepID=A0A6L6QGP3_9BURK|nr:glycerol-3-phosphate dehydrogenase/oxidase [Massilia eburnea]MTW11290.1 FAD-dependent oxidoreductase [Massilia eburnea]
MTPAPHWAPGGRTQAADLLAREWDLLVVGGGITGAGILLEAARRGLRALLVEQRDFAWGTSSRSSKLVHGGLRYLKEGQFALTRESVHERDALLRDAPGLVEPQSFAFGDYEGRKPGRRAFLLGLAIYDRMAGQRARHYFSAQEFLAMAPHIRTDGLQGGICYQDAKTDDARLVMRVLHEAQAHGGAALNYCAVQSLVRDGGEAAAADAQAGRVRGAVVRCAVSGNTHQVRAKLVVNATGAWADRLHGKAAARLRPLRGSHLVLPAWRLPLAQAISLMHPRDGRPVFAFPWEGVAIVGTTDVDHRSDLQQEAAITQEETDYLMEALRDQFPTLSLNEDDVLATYAGVRPVIDTGKADPSKEARDHVLWQQEGLLTVTGGKLTTFRAIALDVLRHAAAQLPHWQADLGQCAIFAPAPEPALAASRGLCLAHGQARRLQGRYGAQAAALAGAAQEGELEEIPGTETLWVQLRWAARHESVQHLEDLMLRRSRLGIQLAHGGAAVLARVRAICQPELGWNDQRWAAEEAAYLALCRSNYSLPKARA